MLKGIELPYPLNALEPYYSMETLKLHYEVLYKGYVDNTNKTEENLPKMFPKTGASRTILLVIIILAILAIILYYKNKKIGKTMIMLIICGILISQSTVFAASEIFVGDINQSSVIDDEDIQIMQEYLIKANILSKIEIKQDLPKLEINLVSIDNNLTKIAKLFIKEEILNEK